MGISAYMMPHRFPAPSDVPASRWNDYRSGGDLSESGWKEIWQRPSTAKHHTIYQCSFR